MNEYSISKNYFIPQPSYWPLIGTLGLSTLLVGIINIIHGNWYGHYFVTVGAILFIYMLYGWFSTVINEGLEGLHNQQVTRSYIWGMVWFIATEIFFFGAFFGALFYARLFTLPTLGSGETQALLWPHFHPDWPLFQNPNPTQYVGAKSAISAFGLPAFNTILLVSSGFTITWALQNLKKNKIKLMNLGVLITILLGFSFLCIQMYEYGEAYTHLDLTLKSGIYGTTFFMLTGFHGAHVTAGLIMLTVILVRGLKGHFKPQYHFAFDAVSWYWHFVDVVWVLLFIFVYWL